MKIRADDVSGWCWLSSTANTILGKRCLRITLKSATKSHEKVTGEIDVIWHPLCVFISLSSRWSSNINYWNKVLFCRCLYLTVNNLLFGPFSVCDFECIWKVKSLRWFAIYLMLHNDVSFTNQTTYSLINTLFIYSIQCIQCAALNKRKTHIVLSDNNSTLILSK